ncbi:MAG: hypothetical protein ACJAZO_000647 [Myxococcota bacterium]|jgi:hypothetical protein
MSDTRSTKDLFKSWRSGDAPAGHTMAQRFADWYYAISTSRLGESRGRGPCDTACRRFGEGIVQVTESRALVKWAHDIVVQELQSAGGVARDGDESNAYTNNNTPKALLARAKASLPTEVAVLEAVYGGKMSEDEVDILAKPLGGNPIGVLTARYAVKKWLADNADVPFAVTPDNPILDRAPLPQYESAHMNADEVIQFEHWMLTDFDLCRDIAEFATYSVALRGGLGNVKAAPAATRRKTSTVPAAARRTASPTTTSSNATKGIIIAIAVLCVALTLLMAGATIVFNWS